MRKYTEEERRFLRSHIPGRSYAETAAIFNDWNIENAIAALISGNKPRPPITASHVNSFCGNNGIQTGRTGRFQNGNRPFNKGMKRPPHWKKSSTVFKKGHSPHNHRPVSSTRISVDGYTEIKVSEPNKWRMLHVVVYEETHGKIPSGHVVIFGDGNRQNFDPDNLILVSRSKLLRLNQHNLIGASAELTKTGLIVTDLLDKITEKKKGCPSCEKNTSNTSP